MIDFLKLFWSNLAKLKLYLRAELTVLICILCYKVNGMKKHPHCKWMAIQEPKFIDLIRNEQNIKALKILNKTKL